MADPVINGKNISEACVIAGVLTNCHGTPEACQLNKVPGVQFSDGNGGYQPGDKILPALQDINISQVSITVGDKTSYYKKIAENDLAESKNGKEGEHGFRANAWVKTDAAGNALKGENGKADVVLAFSGYCDNPIFLNRPQTRALHQVGDGNLNPQVNEVPAFIEKTRGALKAAGIETPNIHVAGYSLGSSNALAAAVQLEQEKTPATSIMVAEGVGASLAMNKLRETYQDGSVDRVEKNTVSMRVITLDEQGNHHYSHSAQLRTANPGDNEQARLAVRIDNTVRIAKYGNGEKIHPNNEPVGTTYYASVPNDKNIGTTVASDFDPTHVAPNFLLAIQSGADIKPSIEALKETHKERKLQEFVGQMPPASDARDRPSGLPAEGGVQAPPTGNAAPNRAMNSR